MSDISKIYLFLSQNKDWQNVMDANGDGEIIQAECRYYLKEHLDEIDLQDKSKADNIISKFWNSINSNRIGRSLVNLDENEMNTMNQRVEVFEKFEEYFKNVVMPIIDSNKYVTDSKQKSELIKSVKASLLNSVEDFVDKGGKPEQLEDFLTGKLDDKFYTDTKNKNLVQYAINKTTANIYAQSRIKNEIQTRGGGDVKLADLNDLINKYIQNNVSADEPLDDVISGIDMIIKEYFESDKLTDWNKKQLVDKVRALLESELNADNEIQDLLTKIDNQKFQDLVNSFINNIISSATDDNWKDLMNKESYINDFKATREYRTFKAQVLADETLGTAGASVETTTYSNLLNSVNAADIAGLSTSLIDSLNLKNCEGTIYIKGVPGKDDTNLGNVSLAELYNSDATVILYENESARIDQGDKWDDVKLYFGYLCNVIKQSLINSGMDPHLVSVAMQEIQQAYINKSWYDSGCKNEDDSDWDKDRTRIHDQMNANRAAAAHQICCRENEDGIDAIIYAVKVKDIIDDVIARYNELLKNNTQTEEITENNIVYDKNDKTSVGSILANTIDNKYISAIIAEKSIYQSVVDNAILMFADKKIDSKEEMAKVIAEGILALYEQGAFDAVIRRVDAEIQAEMDALLNKSVNISTDYSASGASVKLAHYVDENGEIIFVNYDKATQGSVWKADKNTGLQAQFNEAKKQLEHGYAGALAKLGFTPQEKANLFNAALFLMLESEGLMYDNHGLQHLFDRLSDIYKKLLIRAANDSSARKYITDYHKNSLVAGTTTSLCETDDNVVGYGDHRLVTLLSMEDNHTDGGDDMVSIDDVSQLSDVNAGGVMGKIYLNKGGEDSDTRDLNNAMTNLISYYIQKFRNIINTSALFEMFQRAQQNAFGVLKADKKQGNDEGEDGLTGYQTYGYGDQGGRYATTNTIYDDYFSIASIILQIAVEMEAQIASYFYWGTENVNAVASTTVTPPAQDTSADSGNASQRGVIQIITDGTRSSRGTGVSRGAR